jgi:YVTN family beta-propeller protein
MLFKERLLFVANTNSDSVSVIDTLSLAVIKTITIHPFSNAPFGSSPDALAMLPRGRLAVSLGANNAVSIYDWRGPSAPSTLLGLIPTAWYPSDIAWDGRLNRLVVAALKGLGPDRAEQGGSHQVLHLAGSLSLIGMPARPQLAKQTRQVAANNRWDTATSALRTAASSGAPKAVPDHIGDPSLIRHVIYIIKENKTYDEVLGDDPRGNSDPKLVEVGRSITPNEHALAAQFPLFDNFYVASLASADGHQWANSAFVDDYVERGFAYGFQRSYPFNGGDSLAYAPSGFIWENALRHGKSVRVFGEFVPRFDGPAARFGHWADWYRDARIMQGKLAGERHIGPGEFQAKSDIPSLDAIIDRDFPPYDTLIPDQYRAEVFLADFSRRVTNHDLPDLTIMTLCDDHTTGIVPDVPTPRAQIADNDLAFGRIVEAVSNSPYWRDTAIFVVEDDAAGGLDHVDGHRSPAFAISPYARRGYVDHTYYTQIDVVRTIEQILGLPPMNQHDLTAAPMWTAFTDSPDFTPYQARPNEIPLDEMNPATSASRIEREWQQLSVRMFAARPAVPDDQDPNLLNRAIWYGTYGFAKPYPGDKRVLAPGDVPRSK